MEPTMQPTVDLLSCCYELWDLPLCWKSATVQPRPFLSVFPQTWQGPTLQVSMTEGQGRRRLQQATELSGYGNVEGTKVPFNLTSGGLGLAILTAELQPSAVYRIHVAADSAVRCWGACAGGGRGGEEGGLIMCAEIAVQSILEGFGDLDRG